MPGSLTVQAGSLRHEIQAEIDGSVAKGGNEFADSASSEMTDPDPFLAVVSCSTILLLAAFTLAITLL